VSLVVVDASAAVAWIVPGQSTEAAKHLLTDPAVSGFAAPFLFYAEVRNALLKLERTKRTTLEQTERGLNLLGTLAITVSPPLSFAHSQTLMTLARGESLSFYDAHYVDLALSVGAELASRDGPLLGAAQRRGVTVMDLR